MPPGREQYGVRPAIVLGLPDQIGSPRFPLVLLTPLTTDRGQSWALTSPRLYPRLPQGQGGLPSDSIVLLDQTRFLSAARISSRLGTLAPAQWTRIRDGLAEIIQATPNRLC